MLNLEGHEQGAGQLAIRKHDCQMETESFVKIKDLTPVLTNPRLAAQRGLFEGYQEAAVAMKQPPPLLLVETVAQLTHTSPE